MPPALQSAVGLVLLAALAWAIGEARGHGIRAIPWRVAVVGLAMQLALAFVLLKVPGSAQLFAWLARGIDAL
ncbi:MAG: nucleoside:proton symporter, partial [Alphaproteobacteria bacterium]|nr:nucleoside:proton symporter [Alphaproteobacteria bacterium]